MAANTKQQPRFYLFWVKEKDEQTDKIRKDLWFNLEAKVISFGVRVYDVIQISYLLTLAMPCLTTASTQNMNL